MKVSGVILSEEGVFIQCVTTYPTSHPDTNPIDLDRCTHSTPLSLWVKQDIWGYLWDKLRFSCRFTSIWLLRCNKSQTLVLVPCRKTWKTVSVHCFYFVLLPFVLYRLWSIISIVGNYITPNLTRWSWSGYDFCLHFLQGPVRVSKLLFHKFWCLNFVFISRKGTVWNTTSFLWVIDICNLLVSILDKWLVPFSHPPPLHFIRPFSLYFYLIKTFISLQNLLQKK